MGKWELIINFKTTKKAELEKLLNEINQKIGTSDDLAKKIAEAAQSLTIIKNQVADLTVKAQQSSELLAQTQTKKVEVENWSEKVKKASEDANIYGELIVQQKSKYSELEKILKI